jgi:poly(3-hydroxybutyrate) depolymerase
MYNTIKLMTDMKRTTILFCFAYACLLTIGMGCGDDSPSPGKGGGGGADDDINSLPKDSGGEHIAKQKGSTDAEFGYYVYLPGGYNDNKKSYPLIVFLHGQGERGNGTTDLSKVLNGGIPSLIKNKKWNVTYPSVPFIVASPQYHPMDGKGNDNNWAEGNTEEIRGFIEHLTKTYRVNPKRIYLTGLSHGGNGVYDYLILQNEATSLIAAAAPIAAYGPNKLYSNAKNTPIWVFCGANDGNANSGNIFTSKRFVSEYNKLNPKHQAKITVYPGVGHDCWTRTYSLSGMNDATDANFAPYDINLYDWFLQFKRE